MSSGSQRVTQRPPGDAVPDDVLVSLFLSPDPSFKIFTAEAPTLVKMMKAHHLARPSNFTLHGARHALISHFVSGSCAGTCDVSEFNLPISAENLATFACGSCNELRPITENASIPLDEIDFDLLKRPDHIQPESDSDMEVDDVEHDLHEPWLDDRCPEPRMPMANTPYSSLLIEPDSLGSDPETDEPDMTVCRQCRSNLKAKRVPPLSIANHNYWGPVPPELKDLTVAEETV
ncbi:hypothetical protein B0H13DRAFT_2325422 [Mycena leptocephala]|nr:hypothetical protein B0H13DRAFT_2325422 [Mycena leptocephala]